MLDSKPVDENPPKAVQSRQQAACTSRHLRFCDILLTAVWFGLLAGLGEALVMAVRKFLLHDVMRDASYRVISRHVIWMGPLAHLVLFAGIGLMLFVLGCLWPRIISLRLKTFLFSFVMFFSWKVISFRVFGYAWALLAAGLAMEASRVVARHPDGFRRLLRRTAGWLALAAASLAAVVFGTEAIRRYRAEAKLPKPSADAPNVLLIVLDTVRASSLSVCGHDRRTTPNLEQFAQSGVRFDRAIAPSPWTLPSHASMFTGRWPHELSADYETPLDSTHPTLAELLAAAGYRTAGFVANRSHCNRESGLGRGFLCYDDSLISLEQVLTGCHLVRSAADKWPGLIVGGRLRGRKDASRVTQDFLDWVSNEDPRPFFAFLNYMDAHAPYLPPEPFDRRFGCESPDPPWPYRASSQEPAVHTRLLQEAYEESVAYLDHEIGKMLDVLRDRGLLENTVVILTSDHGEQFGEHGLFDHGNSLYMPLLHVPLIISMPGRIPANKSIDVPVSLRDLPATLIDLVGLEGETGISGISLAEYWNGTQIEQGRLHRPILAEVSGIEGEEGTPVGKGDMVSLVVGDYHYIRNGDGSEELYDYSEDTEELRNLVPLEEGEEDQEMLGQCRKAMKEILPP